MEARDSSLDQHYQRLRWQVFVGIFVGYAGYYLVRKNFSLVMPDLKLLNPSLNNTQLGLPLSIAGVAYGFSKFLMGSVSDRSNPRWFLPLGLTLSALCVITQGLWQAAATSLTMMVLLQGLNGWVNGMGWAPCGKTLVHWFSKSERGKAVSLWNLAHNVGGALAPKLALAGVTLFGIWQAKLWFNGAVALAIALLCLLLLRPRPVDCGLPEVESWRQEPEESVGSGEQLSFRQIFLNHVLPNRLLWLLAVANAFLYLIRNGTVDWIPNYLQTVKGFTQTDSATAVFLFELAGIPGTLLVGWLSDRFFRSRRAPLTALFMLPTMAALLVYGLNRHGPLWIDISCLATAGFFIYGPVMLIGLQALEMVPKGAAGTAAGFTGFFGYVFGTAFAGSGVGWIMDHSNWLGVTLVMLGCCLLTLVFALLSEKSARSDSK
jgi:MFS transporter, OPA family, glycerol-3-phosphate transporter